MDGPCRAASSSSTNSNSPEGALLGRAARRHSGALMGPRSNEIARRACRSSACRGICFEGAHIPILPGLWFGRRGWPRAGIIREDWSNGDPWAPTSPPTGDRERRSRGPWGWKAVARRPVHSSPVLDFSSPLARFVTWVARTGRGTLPSAIHRWRRRKPVLAQGIYFNTDRPSSGLARPGRSTTGPMTGRRHVYNGGLHWAPTAYEVGPGLWARSFRDSACCGEVRYEALCADLPRNDGRGAGISRGVGRGGRPSWFFSLFSASNAVAPGALPFRPAKAKRHQSLASPPQVQALEFAAHGCERHSGYVDGGRAPG